MTSDLLLMHRSALDHAGELVARVGDPDLSRETPCAGWTLAELLAHMVGQHHGFATTVRDGDAPASAYRPVACTSAAWDASVDELVTAFAGADLGRKAINIEFSSEPLPVEFLVAAQLLDTVVHAWDVARSLGTNFTPAADVADAVLQITRRVPDDERRDAPGAAFAHALPSGPDRDDAPWPTALRLLGRDPAWSSSAAR